MRIYRKTLAVRILTPVAFAVALSMLPAGPAWSGTDTPSVEAPVSLNARIEISGNTVTLGDVFENAGAYADRPIGRAPDLGKSVTLSARWLARVAKAFNLDWRPASQFETSSIVRISQIVKTATIRAAIMDALEYETGGGGNFEIELDNNFVALHVPTDRPATLGVEQLRIDKRTQRFTAILVAPVGSSNAVRKAVAGRMLRLVDVPVPTRRIMRGEIIRNRDIEMVEMRMNRLSSQIVVEPSMLIGLAARRTLKLGAPVASNSIEPPVMIEKGSLVTVRARTANMVLTARAKAMESGGMNDVVRVLNMQSNRMIEAVVTGPGQLDVNVPADLAMN